MLPHIKTPFKTAAITLVTALTLAVTSAAPAAAWGQREQDVLKGAAGALILKAIIDDAKRDRRAQPVYREEPEPRYGHGHPKKHEPRRTYDDRQTSVYNTPAARAFNVPASWKLRAQMPFGSHEAGFNEKTFIEDDGRFLTYAGDLALAAE